MSYVLVNQTDEQIQVRLDDLSSYLTQFVPDFRSLQINDWNSLSTPNKARSSLTTPATVGWVWFTSVAAVRVVRKNFRVARVFAVHDAIAWSEIECRQRERPDRYLVGYGWYSQTQENILLRHWSGLHRQLGLAAQAGLDADITDLAVAADWLEERGLPFEIVRKAAEDLYISST